MISNNEWHRLKAEVARLKAEIAEMKRSRMVTTEQAGKILGLSSEAVRKRWQRGQIDGEKRGKRIFVYV